MDIALVLNLITTVAIVVGLAFGLFEVRQALRARRDLAAVDIVRTVQTQEIRRAMTRILSLPDAVAPEVVRADQALLDAAVAVDSACEMWGSMVFEGIVELHMLDRMVGGWVRGTWVRLEPWITQERIDKRTPSVAEWWQWLYEMLEADPDPGKKPGVHVSYRGRIRN
ncbi:MAG TPA: hypothetical protein VMZ33_00745 [Candidatus Limnocylindrales bacterium]|nr:hypothetical protein [Candidatus Limnocylindrales bacterium]